MAWPQKTALSAKKMTQDASTLQRIVLQHRASQLEIRKKPVFIARFPAFRLRLPAKSRTPPRAPHCRPRQSRKSFCGRSSDIWTGRLARNLLLAPNRGRTPLPAPARRELFYIQRACNSHEKPRVRQAKVDRDEIENVKGAGAGEWPCAFKTTRARTDQARFRIFRSERDKKSPMCAGAHRQRAQHKGHCPNRSPTAQYGLGKNEEVLLSPHRETDRMIKS